MKADQGRERAGVDPDQRHRADAKHDDAEHRRRTAVDLGEEAHHRAEWLGMASGSERDRRAF